MKPIDFKQKNTMIYAETSIDQTSIHSLLPHAIVHRAIKSGDLIKAVSKHYDIIIIIDGNFEYTQAIWHKEILWAVKKGLKIIGCSSMGALRASELDRFGVTGYGYVYETYKNNITDDDSEVAIHYYKHKEAIISSLPLINFRYSLNLLTDDQRLTHTEADDIFKQIKSIFYKKRTWQALKEVMTKKHFQLIKANYIDIKYKDAYHCLKQLPMLLAMTSYQTFTLPYSLFLKRLIDEITVDNEFVCLKKNLITYSSHFTFIETIETKRHQELMKLTHLNLTLTNHALNLIQKKNIHLTDDGFMQHLKRFRLLNQLQNGQAFKQWCSDKQLDFSSIEQTFKDYFLVKRILSSILNQRDNS
ncbi:hypothetical protein L3V82_05890 [Thiotrichales bacterium 19S3-7]|nr:hypothetical protein [Thiotrichales bacterium 19S3-7]MCF6801626.1 hypothetical protein [Thiotrichales bacterium 19S3-11]